MSGVRLSRLDAKLAPLLRASATPPPPKHARRGPGVDAFTAGRERRYAALCVCFEDFPIRTTREAAEADLAAHLANMETTP